jgi:long-subunit acyl-CoA synthetase (AMP-forming)
MDAYQSLSTCGRHAGEYIAAERLEIEYKREVLVDQIWVHGTA